MGDEVPKIVTSAIQAAETAESLRPDLVLMDIQLEDDVDRLHKILDLMPEHNVYDVHLGRDARDDMELSHHEYNKINLVILGLSQPGISNQEVLNELINIDADAKVLLVSGHPLNRSFAQGASEVLLKPFNTTQLLQAVRRCLDSDS